MPNVVQHKSAQADATPSISPTEWGGDRRGGSGKRERGRGSSEQGLSRPVGLPAGDDSEIDYGC